MRYNETWLAFSISKELSSQHTGRLLCERRVEGI